MWIIVWVASGLSLLFGLTLAINGYENDEDEEGSITGMVRAGLAMVFGVVATIGLLPWLFVRALSWACDDDD